MIMNHTENYLLVFRNSSELIKIKTKQILGDDSMELNDEQHEKLRIIANKIDTDQNGQISRDEMRTYVEQRIKFVLFYISI